MPTFGSLKGLQGLTAGDRSASDKAQIANIMGEDQQSYKVPSLSNPNVSQNRMYLQGIHDTNAIMHNTYQDLLQDYKKRYAVDDPNVIVSTTDIRDIAQNTSPYFKKYNGTDYIDLKANDWARLAAQYEATRDAYGEEQAVAVLNSAIKDNVAKNQPWYEQAWYGFTGMGASAAGAIVSTVGAVKGAWDYISGEHEDIKGLSKWENFMDAVMDNSWSRYGNDIVQYGTLFPDAQDEARELGISKLQIVESAEQEDSYFSSATPWVALQSGGFTVASMFTGYGEAKLAQWAFKGLSYGAKAVKTGEALTSTLTKIQKAENFTNKFVIPGMVGTTEGLIEGLNTKQEAAQRGIEMVMAQHKQSVADEVDRRLRENYTPVEMKDPNTGAVTQGFADEDGNLVDIDALYQQVWSEFEPKYKDALDQVNFAASRAGINNFYANSLINGLMNSTLKAGLQAAPVRKSLQNSRLFGWAQPASSRFNISGSGAGTTVTPKFGKYTKVWNLAKEPLGEFGEEYLQSVSDATMRGGAENNLHNFIENKYLGDGSAAVGDSFGSDYAAAWTALTGSLVDKETIKSGIYGAVSSIMGTPARGFRSARTGRLNADGTAETTLFGRGLNEFGERESNWERLGRILPWRSGLSSAYRDTRLHNARAIEAAESLQEWLRDPNNQGKFDGLVGTFNWARQMGEAGKGNDEFGYRNSVLGKTINDIFMLQHLEGTQMHQAIMDQLSEVANLEEGTELANQYIQNMRDDVNTDANSMSDEEVLSTLKKNANLMLSTIEKVQQESDHVDRLLGNVDNDTKQTLVYGQLMMDDWRERSQQLRREIGDVSIDNSTEHSTNLTARQKEIIARYNSLENAQRELQRLEKSAGNLQQDIKALQGRKNLTDNEKRILKQKKANLKSTQKAIKRLETVRNIDTENVSTVLNESEIMELDPISRATMLLNGKKRTYLATHDDEEFAQKKAALNEEIDKLQVERDKALRSRNKKKKRRARELQDRIDDAQNRLETLMADEKPYFSDEQQSVIDNIIGVGTSQDRDFFSKVVDLGRMENSMKTFYEQYNAILSDRDSFNNFVFRAKQAAADIATKRKYESLSSLQDYTEFASEMDKVFNDGTAREQSILTREFKKNNNANFEKYVSDRNLIQGLVNHVAESGKFEDMEDNDIDMFVHTLTYLTNKGVDLTDENAVVNALSETDNNGNLEFRKYVDDVNSQLDEVDRTAFTSIGEAIQNFKNVMESYNGELNEQRANNSPITPAPTSPENSAPSQPQEPVSPSSTEPAPVQRGNGFWDVGTETPEGGFVNGDGTVVGPEAETTGEGEVGNGTGQAATNPILDAFRENSNEEVANAAEVVLNTINNTPAGRISDNAETAENARTEARTFVEGLSNNSFDNVEEFVDALNASANARETQSEEGVSETANLLRQAAAKVNRNSANSRPVEQGSQRNRSTSLLDRTRRTINNSTQALNTVYNMFPNASNTSSFIASMNIDVARQRFPNSPTVQYYDKYGIDDALRDGILEGNPDIYFITDNELTQAVSQEMGNRYSDALALPIVAVVESASGPITIGEKSYQPVSVMASTNRTDSAGSTHMGPIRQLAMANQGNTGLVKLPNGNPLITKPYGTPKAYPVDRNYRGRNNVVEVGINGLSDNERTQLEATPKAQRRNNPAYQKAKRNFLKRLIVGPDGSGEALFFNQPRLNGRFNPIRVFKMSVHETSARNSDLTFEQAIATGNSDDIINFNSRTSRAASSLANFISSFNTDEMIFDLDDNGQIIPSDATKGVLSGMASTLERGISNFLVVPTGQGWTYSISPTMEVVDENRVMDLNLVNTNTGQIIKLTSIHSGMSQEDIRNSQVEFIRNLLADETGAVRMQNATESLVSWGVSYPDIKNKDSNNNAANNVSDIYDDGILGAAATTFNYRIQGIAVHNPLRSDGAPIYNQVTNSGNAQGTGPLNQPTVAANNQVQSGSASVDSETGAVLGGTPAAPVNPAQQNAERTVRQIEEDSRHINLSDDGSCYIDSRTGIRYARVTSVIAADEQAGDRFDPNSPWAVPSSNIGTGVDEFVRDFFAGKIYSVTGHHWSTAISRSEADDYKLEDYYPNATREQLNAFANQLQVLKNELATKGLTVVPRDVTVTGSLDVLDANGDIHTINVAGTLDLLAYDGRGNFYVFDMKTNRSGIDSHKKAKYARQLSLYKKFLEDKYGVTVNSLELIPIRVDYPTPSGARSGGRSGTADYSVSPEKSNQLLIDGRNFLNSHPTLEPRIPVDYQEPHIVWDKLTDEERQMFQGIQEEVSAQSEEPVTPVEAAPSEPSVDTTDPTLGVGFNDDYLGDMFGVDDLNNFQVRLDEDGRIIQPLGEGEHTADEVLDAYKMINEGMPDGYFRLADMAFEACKKLGIKFVVDPELHPNGRYTHDTGIVRYNSKSIESNTLLHEAIHAAIGYYLNNAHRESLPKNIQAAIRTLESIQKEMRETLERSAKNDTQRSLLQFTFMESGYYGLTNLQEFAAELSSPIFRATIKRYDAKYGKNTLNRIIDAIANLLGIRKGYRNVEEAAYQALKELLTEVNVDAYNKHVTWAKGMRRYQDMLENMDNRFTEINVKSSTLDELDANFYAGHTKTVTLHDNENHAMSNRPIHLRRGSVILGEVKGPNGNFLGRVTLVVTNNPTINEDGSRTLDIRLFNSSELEGNAVNIRQDEDGYVYFTRNRDVANMSEYRFVPANLKWDTWENFKDEDGNPINVEATRENLERFYTEKEWNTLTNEEMEHELRCKGVF